MENASEGTISESAVLASGKKKKNVQVKINIILNYRKYVNTSLERTLDY